MTAAHKAPATSMWPNAALPDQPAQGEGPACARSCPDQTWAGGTTGTEAGATPPGPTGGADRTVCVPQTRLALPRTAASGLAAASTDPVRSRRDHACWSAWRGGPCGQAVARAVTLHACGVGHRLGGQPQGRGDGKPDAAVPTAHWARGGSPRDCVHCGCLGVSTSIRGDWSFGESPGP